MIIYQPQTLLSDQIDIRDLAAELTNTLLPEAQIFFTQVKKGNAHLLVRNFSTLIAVELCTTAVGEEAFESILKLLLDLESTRKVQNDPLLKNVGVYLLAPHFSYDFLKRLPFEGLRIQLFEWCFIRSEAKAAADNTVYPVREKFSNGVYLKSLEFSKDQKVISREITQGSKAGLIAGDTSCHTHLTTPEVIALASLGLEIRNSRFQSVRTA